LLKVHPPKIGIILGKQRLPVMDWYKRGLESYGARPKKRGYTASPINTKKHV